MIVAVDSGEDHSVLRDLLVEFHEWMVEHAGDVYDPQSELTEDVESLKRERESWAWIARNDRTPAGCVLLHGVTDTVAEFRRLWVRPTHRGTGIGRELTLTVIEKADSQGYETLGLTTPPWAETSHALYEYRFAVNQVQSNRTCGSARGGNSSTGTHRHSRTPSAVLGVGREVITQS